MMRARWWILAVLLVLSVAPEAQASRLAQLPGAAGCIIATTVDDCAVQSGLGNPNAIAVHGNYVYVSSISDDAIHIYDRDASTGALTPRAVDANGCISVQVNACADARALNDPGRMVFSPDGSTLYVVDGGDRGVTALTVSSVNGSLTQSVLPQSCATRDGSANSLASQCALAPPIDQPIGVAVSPNGNQVYVSGQGTNNNGFVDVLDVVNGGLAQHAVASGGCAEDTVVTTGCLDARALASGRLVTVTPDSKNVYATGTGSAGGISAFARNSDGSLGLIAGSDGCVQSVGGNIGCYETPLLGTEPYPITFASDTRGWVGAVSGSHVTELARNATTGGLSIPGPCVAARTDGAFAACKQASEMFGTVDFALTPNASELLIGLRFGRGVISVALGADGSMTPTPAPEGCLATGGTGHTTPCQDPRGFARVFGQDFGPNGIALSPDGHFFYAASPQNGEDRAGILAGRRDASDPVCQDAAAAAVAGKPTTVPLPCSDADGDAVTISIVSSPAHGTLGSVNGGSVSYTPVADYAGADSFTFKASANGHDSPPATAHLSVTKPAGGGLGGPGPGGSTTPRLTSGVVTKWKAGAKSTRLTKLTLTKLPAGVTVQLICTGKKKTCPFKKKKSKRFATASASSSLLSLLKKKNERVFRVGAKFEVRMTLPNTIGKSVTFTIRKKLKPRVTTLCVAPGASKPSKC